MAKDLGWEYQGQLGLNDTYIYTRVSLTLVIDRMGLESA